MRSEVDRIASRWLSTQFMDANAEFLYIPPEKVYEIAKRDNAIPFDAAGAERTHSEEDGEERVSFDAVTKLARNTTQAAGPRADGAVIRSPPFERPVLPRWRKQDRVRPRNPHRFP